MAREQKLIHRIINSLKGADRLWSEKAAPLAPGELVCRSGCFGCCVGLFAISLPEALALRSAVAALPEETRAAILARAARAVERSAPAFPGDSAAGLLDPERTADVEDAWLLAVRETACPALDLPSGRCAVYAARPTACRTHGLALASRGEVLLPACELNLPSAPPGRVLETAIDAALLRSVEQAAVEVAAEAGLPAGVETSVAHALAGTAFASFERRGP